MTAWRDIFSLNTNRDSSAVPISEREVDSTEYTDSGIIERIVIERYDTTRDITVRMPPFVMRGSDSFSIGPFLSRQNKRPTMQNISIKIFVRKK